MELKLGIPGTLRTLATWTPLSEEGESFSEARAASRLTNKEEQ